MPGIENRWIHNELIYWNYEFFKSIKRLKFIKFSYFWLVSKNNLYELSLYDFLLLYIFIIIIVILKL